MSTDNTKAKRPYRRERNRPKLVTFPVHTKDGDATVTAHNYTIAQFRGLDDQLIGEISEDADPTGGKYLRERILKLELAVVKIEDVDPDDLEATKGDVGKLLRLEGNEDLAWLTYEELMKTLFGRHSKSSDVGAGTSDGTGELEADERHTAVA